MANRRKRLSLADQVRDELAEVPGIRRGSPALFADLAALLGTHPVLRDHAERSRIGVEWVRDCQRVAKALRPALDHLRKVLFTVRPYVDHEFEKACPGWRDHLIALHGLIPVADRCAESAPPLPGPGHPQALPRKIASRVAEILAGHGVNPTRGQLGTFGRVLTVILSTLDYPDVDIEGLTRAVVLERRAKGTNPS